MSQNETKNNGLILPNIYSKTHLNNSENISVCSYEERVKLLIIRDLQRLGWSLDFSKDLIQLTPPQFYDKEVIRRTMSFKREELINDNKEWIKKNIQLAIQNLADGRDVLKSKIKPIIEVCETPKQHKLFKLLRFYWSSPYSEYVGRRIKLIIRDAGLPNQPVIGIIGLGSPIIHIPERDDFIGWDKNLRTERLNYMMDAYVIGALPPYNHLLGGKLISYLITSKEVRQIFKEKYSGSRYDELAGVFTTSLYGRSSQYNRLKFKDDLLFKHIGFTKGFGSLHLTMETIDAMKNLLVDRNIIVSNRFGNGPSWTMRLIRSAGDEIGFNSNDLLCHSFKRSIYYVPFAKNTKEFLLRNTDKLVYKNNSVSTLTKFWRSRWLENRLKNEAIKEQVNWTFADDFYNKILDI